MKVNSHCNATIRVGRAALRIGCAAVLLLLLCASALAQTLPPLPSDLFDFQAGFYSLWGVAPLAYTNVIDSTSDGGYGLIVDTTNEIPAYLNYKVQGNINYVTGTILFYFAPNWSSVSLGGTGPGERAYFIGGGDWRSNSPNGLFVLYADAGGSNICFGGVGAGDVETYMRAQISWSSNVYHQIGVEWAEDSDCELYLDGALAATGDGSTIAPTRSTWTNGIFIGSDNLGYEQARGAFLEMETWTVESGGGYTNEWLTISNDIATWEAALGGGPFGAMMGLGGGVLISGGPGTNGITGNSASPTTQTSQTAGTGPNTTATGATTPEQIAAIQAARAAEDAAYFSNNIAPYLVPDLGITSDALKSQIVTNLLILSSNLNAMQTAQHAAVSNLLQRQAIPMPQSWIDGKGNSCYFDHMNADGSPAIKVTQGLDAVETVGPRTCGPGTCGPAQAQGSVWTAQQRLKYKYPPGTMGRRGCAHKSPGVHDATATAGYRCLYPPTIVPLTTTQHSSLAS